VQLRRAGREARAPLHFYDKDGDAMLTGKLIVVGGLVPVRTPDVEVMRTELTMADIPRLTRMPDLLTAAQRDDEMRREASRRFVRGTWCA